MRIDSPMGIQLGDGHTFMRFIRNRQIYDTENTVGVRLGLKIDGDN